MYKEMFVGNYGQEDKIRTTRLFYKEMKLLQVMKHANIVCFIGGVASPVGSLLECMEFHFYMDSSIGSVTVNTLHGVLSHLNEYSEFERHEREHNLPMKAACHTASGLLYMHQCKIGHRDLKPLNILASNRGGIIVFKLTDFGEARSNLIHTCPNLNIGSIPSDRGTLVYNGPELTLEDSVLDLVGLIMHDVWCYGMVIFLIWNADVRKPWDFELTDRHHQARSVIKRCMIKKKLPLSAEVYEMPAAINKLYLRCCQYQANNRPTMKEVHRYLMTLPQAEVAGKPMKLKATSATQTK